MAIERSDREAIAGQQGHVIWFTGLSGAGKTTLACGLEQQLLERGVLTARLDGDVLRAGLNTDLGFSAADRAENIRRVSEVANILTLSGVVVLVAVISPFSAGREAARRRIGAARFSLVHVATSLAACEARDPKGLYRRARAGELKDFTGISSPYEVPQHPDMRLETAGRGAIECVDELVVWLAERHLGPS